MRDIDLYIFALCGLWLIVAFLVTGRRSRDWREQASALLGILIVSYAGLRLYGQALMPLVHASRVIRGTLLGMSLGIAICLLMAGWFKDAIKKTRGRQK
jgi:hypothetical protein